VAIAFGLVLVAGALSKGLTAQPPTTVYCGSDAMYPGDTCEEDKNGAKHTYSYEDMRSQAAAGGAFGSWASLIGGGALVVLGAVKLVAAIRRRGSGGSGPSAPQEWAPPPQQYQPQQYQPQGQPQYPSQYPPQPQYQPQPPQNFGPQGH
jgi:hypothetical protein